MMKHKVFKVIPKDKVPKGAKILSSTWAIEKKANGILRAQVNAQGFEQRNGEHYNSSSIASPVVNKASIFIILILIALARMIAELNDIKVTCTCPRAFNVSFQWI